VLVCVAASVPTKQVQGKPIIKVAKNTVMIFVIFISFSAEVSFLSISHSIN
jgi:hypothetical protein